MKAAFVLFYRCLSLQRRPDPSRLLEDLGRTTNLSLAEVWLNRQLIDGNVLLIIPVDLQLIGIFVCG